MSSVSRVFAILDLFSQEQPVWYIDDIIAEMGYSRPTGYRYVRELVEAGFLQKVAAGRYALGARIVVLDNQLRQTDPVLRAAGPWMRKLVAQTGFDAVLSSMFGYQVVDTYRVNSDSQLELGYGRGRLRPLFQGAAPKVLLAHLPRAQMLKLYETHADEIAQRGMGDNWTAFRKGLAAIRKEGFYYSLGELEEVLGGAAVPLLDSGGDVLAALTLVGTVDTLRVAGAVTLREALQPAAQQICASLSAHNSYLPPVALE